MARPRGSRNKTVEAEIMRIHREVRFSLSDERDPIMWLESRRKEYLERLELIIDEARENGDSELELKGLAFALRLTSVYKTKVDVSASQLGLLKAPDLSGKSDEELRQLETAIESTEVKEQ